MTIMHFDLRANALEASSDKLDALGAHKTETRVFLRARTCSQATPRNVCVAFQLSRKRRKSLLRPFLGLMSSLAVAWLLTGCGKPATQPTQRFVIQTARAESAEGLRAGSGAAYIGLVRVENETDLSFKVGGIVEVIGAEPGEDWKDGSEVKTGMVLAGLKQSDFTNALNSAQAQASLAQKQLDRFRALRAKDAISQQELDVAEANGQTTKSRLRQAEQDLKDSQIRALLDGAVLARYVNTGQTVAPGKPVLRFADTRRMQVEVGVPDRVVSYFSPGKEVGVEISALEGHPPFPGRVSEVAVAASQEGRLFRVVIKVDNAKGLLRSGMTATVRAGGGAHFSAGSTLVPLSSLVTCPPEGKGPNAFADQLAVFVVKDNKAVRRPVKTGDIVKSSIIITEGLQPGDEVATSGASFLYDGQMVETFSGASISEP
jgi:RND family efflux transporter MFP subunit